MYECDRNCGACCKGGLIVEASWIDVMREPKILEKDWAVDSGFKGHTVQEMKEAGPAKSVMLAAGTKMPCRFLDNKNRCTIYKSRPNWCVLFEPGDEQCQQCRKVMGLPPLMPKEGK